MSGNTFYCQHCDRTLNSKNEFDQHCKGKKHTENERMALEREAASRRVFVPNIARLRDPKNFLAAYFSHFGVLQRISLHGKQPSNSATVEFRDTESVARVLSQKRHKFEGFPLYVKRYNYRPPKWEQKRMMQQQSDQEEKNKLAQTQKEIMDVLMSAESLTQQMNLVAERLKLDRQEREMRIRICDELNKIFSPYFEKCSVHQFGSSVNGFGAKGCDIDLFLDLYTPESSEAGKKPKTKIPLPYHKDIKSVKIDCGPLSEEQLQSIELYDRVKLVARILSSRSSSFTETITIPSARCPVVKFAHKASGLKCDLSLNNRKALHNSHLLRLYATEPRVHKLVSLVRLWARTHELSSSGNTNAQFSSYALTLIVIYYLMCREPKIIPLVVDVADCIKGVKKEIVDEWECISVPTNAVLPPSENNETDVELLKGFFDFYAHSVNWDTDALVTKNATVLPRSSISQLPAYTGCKEGCMTVLDPFVLNHNVVAGVNEKTKHKFIEEVKRAQEVMRDWPECDPGTRSDPWGIAAILMPNPESESDKPGKSPGEKSRKKRHGQGNQAQGQGDGTEKGSNPPAKHSTFRVEGEQESGEFFIAIQPTLSTMSDEKLISLSESNGHKPTEEWCVLAEEMILTILTTVFMVEVHEKEVGGQMIEKKKNMEEKGKEDASTCKSMDKEEPVAEEDVMENVEEEIMADAQTTESHKQDKERDVNLQIEDTCYVEEAGENETKTAKEGNEFPSGKRTSEEACLDNSSNESLEAASGDTLNKLSPKFQNPKKRFCEDVEVINNDAAERRLVDHSVRDKGTAEVSSDDVMFNDDDRGVDDDGIGDDDNNNDDDDDDEDDDTLKEEDVTIIENKLKNEKLKTGASVIESKEESAEMQKTVKSSTPDTNTEVSSLKDALQTVSGETIHKHSSYSCRCTNQMWMMRKKIRSTMGVRRDASSLSLEQEISKRILKELDRLQQQQQQQQQLRQLQQQQRQQQQQQRQQQKHQKQLQQSQQKQQQQEKHHQVQQQQHQQQRQQQRQASENEQKRSRLSPERQKSLSPVLGKASPTYHGKARSGKAQSPVGKSEEIGGHMGKTRVKGHDGKKVIADTKSEDKSQNITGMEKTDAEGTETNSHCSSESKDKNLTNESCTSSPKSRDVIGKEDNSTSPSKCQEVIGMEQSPPKEAEANSKLELRGDDIDAKETDAGPNSGMQEKNVKAKVKSQSSNNTGYSESKPGVKGQDTKVKGETAKDSQMGTKPGNKGNESADKSEEFVTEFSCDIFQQNCDKTSELPHILVKLQPTEASISSFRNLYCSFRPMVVRLVTSHLLDD